MNVYWLSVVKDVPPHDYWDHGLLDWMLAKFKYNSYEVEKMPDDAEGGLVVIPARNQKDEVKKLTKEINKLKWCVVILTGDEESDFPWRDLKHPNMRVWVMSPKQDEHGDASWLIGSGFRKEEPDILKKIGMQERVYDWAFSGQVTHPERELMAQQLRGMRGGKITETKGFGQGMPYDQYITNLASAKFAPSPSGPVSPDNFRLYEALEAGSVPIADGQGYWTFLLKESPPFPIISSWDMLPVVMPTLLNDWPENANKVYAWWQVYKRKMVDKLSNDLKGVSGKAPERKLNSDITVIMPTNAIPSHPDTSMIEKTIASVRERIPEAEIIVTFDGLSPELIENRTDYEQYTQKMLWKINNEYDNIIPLVFQQHVHQTGMTREALKLVHTPLILFVEHDTPLVNETDFEGLSDIVKSGYANIIRLLHEAQILDDHKKFMLDEQPIKVKGVPLIRTNQWSQRPHLASTEYYQSICNGYWDDQPRFIEHVMYGVLLQQDWSESRLHIYAPSEGGTMLRSGNLNGRVYEV